MKAKLLLIKQIIRCALIKIIPIKRNRVVFTSLDGHFSDSPKYICRRLHELCEKAEIVWLVDKSRLSMVPDYAVPVDIASIRAIRYIGSAHVLVDNVYANKEVHLIESGIKAKLIYKLFTFLKKKRGQLAFSTWHGTPLKRMGRDQVDSTQIDFSCHNTTLILENRFTADVMRRLTYGKIKIEVMGCPRNDILLKNDPDMAAQIRRKLNLPVGKRIVLFAPTFRSDDGGTITQASVARSGLNQIEAIDFDKLFLTLKEKFGGEWVMIFRCHYHVEKKTDFELLNRKAGGRLINGNLGDDMSEYLLCTDVLITDVSSSMFDFSVNKKPCFLFFPDMDYYVSRERGLYMQFEQLPFPVSDTFDGLLHNINVFNEKEYLDKLSELRAELGYEADPDSSGKIAEYILKTGVIK